MNTSETANDKSQNPQDNTSLNEYGQYVLIAYRFGSRERHSYLVDVCSGIDTASERAEHEVNERSGKYSVVVFAKRKTGDIEEIYEAKCPKHYYQAEEIIKEKQQEIEKWKTRFKQYEEMWFRSQEKCGQLQSSLKEKDQEIEGYKKEYLILFLEDKLKQQQLKEKDSRTQ
jgi:alpha-galactosidase/6-phospho-beta-glucosidase family protein